MINNIRFKNIKFLNISDKDFPIIIKKKGLFLFPSGPGLSNLDKKPTYLKALHNADFNFFDSGYFVILLSFLKNIKVSRIAFHGTTQGKYYFCNLTIGNLFN